MNEIREELEKTNQKLIASNKKLLETKNDMLNICSQLEIKIKDLENELVTYKIKYYEILYAISKQ
jgi:hypothetical protein